MSILGVGPPRRGQKQPPDGVARVPPGTASWNPSTPRGGTPVRPQPQTTPRPSPGPRPWRPTGTWTPPQERSGWADTAPTTAAAEETGQVWRPPTARDPSDPRRFRPGLDGLRALAVVAVLLYHAGLAWMPGGFLGVDLFFVISGFLITTLLIAEVQRAGLIDLPGFYRRRARRLLPALLLLLAVTTLAMALFWPSDLKKDGGDILASLGYVANWWFVAKRQSYFQVIGRPSPFQHLWSLEVEEQFYLVWPMVVGLVLAGRTSARRLAGLGLVAMGAAIASTGWMALLAVRHNVPYGSDGSRIYFGTDTHAMGVLLGAGLAAFLAASHLRASRQASREGTLAMLDALGLLGIAGMCLAMVYIDEYNRALYMGGFLGFAALATLAVLAVDRVGSQLGEFLGQEPMHWIGTRSYGLYLWHWPIYVFTRPGLDLRLSSGPDLLLRLALTGACAELSYRYIEQPIRRHGVTYYVDRLSNLRPRPKPGPNIGPKLGSKFGAGFRPTPQAALAAGALAVVILGVSAALLLGQHRGGPPSLVASRAGAHPGATKGPAPSPGPPGGPWGDLTAIGDSVMLGAATDLQQALPGATINAVEGRQANPTMAEVQSLLSAGHLGRYVVLQLGTNGTIDPGPFNALLNGLAGRTVILLTVHVPRTWQRTDNATLVAAAKAHPFVRLVDWNGAANAHPQWFYNDGVHLRPAGAQAYTTLIVNALKP